MINNSEYEKICMLIKKGNLAKLQEFINLSYENGNKKYLAEAREALKAYLDYYPQSFIKYLDDTGVKENPLVEAIFGIENPKSSRIIISDNVSGGFILNSDEVIDGGLIQREHIFREKGLSLTSPIDCRKLRSIKIIIKKFDKIDKKKLRLVSDVETTKKEASVYGRGYANPHYFERTRYDSFKLLGEDAKIYVSSPKSTPMLYGESSKGKGIVLGLRK